MFWNPVSRFIERRLHSMIERAIEARDLAFISELQSVGADVFVQPPVTIHTPENVVLGDRVSVAAYVHIWGRGGVEIGANTMIGSHCAITSATHDPQATSMRDTLELGPVRIGKDVWLGAHSVIFPGVDIGNGAIVGAGAIVRKDVEPYEIVAGVPAQNIRYRFGESHQEATAGE